MSGHNDIPTEIQISEHELRSMTRELDDMHQESMRDVRASMATLTDRISGVTRTVATRRHFLMGGAAIVGAGALAACGSSSSGGSSPSTSGGGSTKASPYTGDLKIVALAAALENLAVAGYGLVLSKAGKGAYGKSVPAAIAEFVTVAQKQHHDHAAAWNGVLAGAKLPKVTTAPLSITNQTVAAVKGAKTIPAVAAVALGLENAAASTYLLAIGAVTDPAGIATAASIAPVEAMHAAILSFVLGKYPVPSPNLSTSGAVPPSALTA